VPSSPGRDAPGGGRRRVEATWELEPVTSLAAVRGPWSALAERGANLFSTWEWTDSWWRHVGRGQLAAATCRHGGGGDVVAGLPLFLVGNRLSLLGTGASDELGPVCAPVDRPAAGGALRRHLGHLPMPWDTFVGEDMPADLAWEELLRGRVTRRRASPVLRADGMSWQDFLSTRSANFRAQVRARQRRLWRDHGAVLHETEDLTALERDLETLFHLHVARWGWARAQRFAGRRARAFMGEFAALALQRGWLRLRILRLEGRPAAAMLNFRFGGSEWFYQGGRDPALDRLSVGFVLQALAVQAALDDGVHSYRFLRGDEIYKRRFANHDVGVVTVRVERQMAGAPTAGT